MDSNEPDLFGQLPSASENPSRKQSSENTGPKSRSTTTLEPSQRMNLRESTSSAEDFHASPGPSPGSSEAQKMTVTSGQRWLPLLKSYGLDGSLGRMCEALLTNRWASSAAFLTWKASDINASLLFCLHVQQERRTEGIASGLWATPRTSDGTGGPRKLDEKGRRISQSNPKLVFGANLADQVRMWPTPNAGDDRDRGNLSMPSIQRRQRLGKQLNLSMVVSEKSGALNPEWVEWLMGFPPGWTNLTSDELQPELKTGPEDLKPSETPSSPKSLSK